MYRLPRAARIIFFGLHDPAVLNRDFYIGRIELILGHFLYGMHRHIITAFADRGSYSLKRASGHLWLLH